MPRPHQNFHPVQSVKLLGIMFINGCWPTVLYIVTTEDADGWCQNGPVESTLHPGDCRRWLRRGWKRRWRMYVRSSPLQHDLRHWEWLIGSKTRHRKEEGGVCVCNEATAPPKEANHGPHHNVLVNVSVCSIFWKRLITLRSSLHLFYGPWEYNMGCILVTTEHCIGISKLKN